MAGLGLSFDYSIPRSGRVPSSLNTSQISLPTRAAQLREAAATTEDAKAFAGGTVHTKHSELYATIRAKESMPKSKRKLVADIQQLDDA